MGTRSDVSRFRWLLVPLAVVVVGLGVWIAGGVVTDDERVAKALTAVWFALAGLVAVAMAWRYRTVAAPVLLGYALSVAGIGGFLLYTSTVDQVVDEDVVVAGDPTPAPDVDAEANRLLATGDFTDGEHPTDGVASVVLTPDRHVLTLTMFATDPGPDLRVYLVSSGDQVTDGVDLGGLKGNRGDQQYAIPAGVSSQKLRDASVVIWCRAFSVAFGTAELKA